MTSDVSASISVTSKANSADTSQFKMKLVLSMIADFGLCFIMEKGCKFLFADLEPAELVTRGRERREKRRALEEQEKAIKGEVKKTQ